MKNVSRIINRGKKKPQDKRKNPSISSPPELQQGNHLSVVPAGSAMSPVSGRVDTGL